MPYGWQAKAQRVALPTASSQRESVFGLLSDDNELTTYCTDQKVNSAFLIECIGKFVDSQLDKVTLLVLDNAPIHRSKAFLAAAQGWEDKGLLIWFLPPYCPHLNRIERLWLRIKYSWLQAADYFNKQTLQEGLQRIFQQFGDRYNIHFRPIEVSNNYS